MYKLLEAQAERCLATFTPPEAAMYLSALARAGTLRPGHLTAFQPVIADMDDELGGKQTATLLWALATAGSAAAGPAADALAGQLSARAKVRSASRPGEPEPLGCPGCSRPGITMPIREYTPAQFNVGKCMSWDCLYVHNLCMAVCACVCFTCICMINRCGKSTANNPPGLPETQT